MRVRRGTQPCRPRQSGQPGRSVSEYLVGSLAYSLAGSVSALGGVPLLGCGVRITKEGCAAAGNFVPVVDDRSKLLGPDLWLTADQRDDGQKGCGYKQACTARSHQPRGNIARQGARTYLLAFLNGCARIPSDPSEQDDRVPGKQVAKRPLSWGLRAAKSASIQPAKSMIA